MKYPLYHSELCPALWDKKDDVWVMKPEICENLMKITKDFVEVYLKEAGIKMTILDVLLIGSSTNFNWTPFSDLDLHILVDYKELGIGKDFAEILLTSIKINWNKEHNITIKDHDVEIYVQDKNTKAESVSVYSVKKCEWIEPPKKENIKFDIESIKKKHKKFKKEIDDMLRTADEPKIVKMLQKLYDFRQYGLDSKMGEFSVENIVFKILRAQGYIQKMRRESEAIYDKEMTINEATFGGEMTPAQKVIHEFDCPEDVQIDLMKYGKNTISIESLFVEKEDRGNGFGTKVLDQLTKLADKYSVAIELEIGGEDSDGGKLIEWYSGYGFVHQGGFWRREPKESIGEMHNWQERDVTDQHSNYYGTDKFGSGLDESIHWYYVEKILMEASYESNAGIMEISSFYSNATDDQIGEFEELAKLGKDKEAWLYIQAFTGSKLIGDETFGTEQEVEIYKKLKGF